MNPIQIEGLVAQQRSWERSVEAAQRAEIGRALTDGCLTEERLAESGCLRGGGRLWPRWLDLLANRWASSVAVLRLGAVMDPGARPAPRECAG